MKNDTYFVSRIFDGEQIHNECLVTVRDGRIETLEPNAPRHSPCEKLNGLLVPGFVDLQINGGGGVQFNHAPSLPTLTKMSSAHSLTGTTSMLPTIMTDSFAVMEQGANAVAQALSQDISCIAGIHFEGPHLSVAKKGMHSGEHIRGLSDKEIALFTRKDIGNVLVTVAPEQVSTHDIALLVKEGVTVFLGHSNASVEVAQAAIDAGAVGFTHLYNAMSGLSAREPGLVGCALASTTTYASIIADLIHVNPYNIRLALNALSSNKLFLVTDAMAPSASKETSFYYADEKIDLKDQRLVTNKGNLAGSVLTMIDAVRNLSLTMRVPLELCLKMATSTPAKAIGREKSLGYLKPGMPADFLLLNEALEIDGVWKHGQLISEGS